MKQVRKIVRQTNQQQEKENLKILAQFFRESTTIMEAAIKKTHEKYPDLSKAS